MRLGAYPCVLVEGTTRRRGLRRASRSASATATATRSTTTTASALEQQGLVLSGLSPDKRLVEMIELPRSPVLRRLPVPPRVQEPADGAAPAVPRFVRAAVEHQRRWRDETAARRLGSHAPTPIRSKLSSRNHAARTAPGKHRRRRRWLMTRCVQDIVPPQVFWSLHFRRPLAMFMPTIGSGASGIVRVRKDE